jgi:hypothetical protein
MPSLAGSLKVVFSSSVLAVIAALEVWRIREDAEHVTSIGAFVVFSLALEHCIPYININNKVSKR